MAGDERVRFCPDCKLNVYNFSAMDSKEVEQLVFHHEGRLCGRYFQRSDGRMLTRDCPSPFRVAIKRVSQFASATFALVLSATPAIAGTELPLPTPNLFQIQAAHPRPILEVIDHAGASVAKAHVELKNQKTGKIITGETDENGCLYLTALPKGVYDATVLVPGFKLLKQESLSLPSQEPLKLQVQLSLLMGEIVSIDNNPVHRIFWRLRHRL